MKKLFLIITVSILSASLMAQPVMKLSKTEHDFGSFKEEAGRQTYEFEVTNTGDSPLVIQNIVASCGCTTPEWTKQPIPPGGKGKITAIYDPQNRPGAFNKTLSVYSNAKTQVAVLSIKGEDIPLSTQLFAVVDVYDALTTDRPYRKAWSKEQALTYIHEQSGKHFSPVAVEAFFDMMRD